MSFRVLALVGVISFPIAGYPQFPIVRNFSPQDYNGAAQNWDLANSQFNYIFVANNAGLMVGNGIGWDCIAVPNGTAVRSVATSMDGTRFYIGAFDEFGYFENVVPLRCGRYVSISSSLSADMARSGDIWTTLVLPDGRIAFQGDRRIYIYNPLSRSVRIFIFKSKIEHLWKTGQRVYAADTSALYLFDKDRFVCMKASESIAVRAVRGSVTLPGISGDVFICRDGTLWTLGPEGPDRIADSAFSTTVAGKNVFCVADCPMRVLVGTVGDGLIILDKKSGEIQLLDRSNGLRNNTILSICPDVDENVWVGLDNGLGYIIFDSPFRTLFTESNGIGTGYASASLGERLYVGTNQGLYHIPLPGEGFNRSLEPAAVTGISGQIWALAEFDGTLLCGADAGTFVVTGSSAYPVAGTGPSWGFRRMSHDSNLVVASTYSGYSILKRVGNKFIFINDIKGTPAGSPNFELDSLDNIWMSNWLKGIYRIRLSDDFHRATSILEFRKGKGLPTDENNLIAKINGRIYMSAVDGFHYHFENSYDYVPVAAGDLARGAMEGKIKLDLNVDGGNNAFYNWLYEFTSTPTYDEVPCEGTGSMGEDTSYFSMAVKGEQAWSGCGFKMLKPQGLSFLDDSYWLHIAFKGDDILMHASQTIKVGNAAFTIGPSDGVNPSLGDYRRDGQWYSFDIPLKDLLVISDPLFPNATAFTDNIITISTGGVPGARVNFDNVFFYRNDTKQIGEITDNTPCGPYVHPAIADNGESSFDFNYAEDIVPINMSDGVRALFDGKIRADYNVDDTNVCFYVWEKTYDAFEPEGANSFGLDEPFAALKTAAMGWSGAAYKFEKPRDLSIVNEEGYYLHLGMRCADYVSHPLYKLGISEDAAWISMGQTGDGIVTDFPRDGKWYYIDIPVKRIDEEAGREIFADASAFTKNLIHFDCGARQGVALEFDNVFFWRNTNPKRNDNLGSSSVDQLPAVGESSRLSGLKGIFSIDGRRLNVDRSQLLPGLYIIDGRKILIK